MGPAKPAEALRTEPGIDQQTDRQTDGTSKRAKPRPRHPRGAAHHGGGVEAIAPRKRAPRRDARVKTHLAQMERCLRLDSATDALQNPPRGDRAPAREVERPTPAHAAHGRQTNTAAGRPRPPRKYELQKHGHGASFTTLRAVYRAPAREVEDATRGQQTNAGHADAGADARADACSCFQPVRVPYCSSRLCDRSEPLFHPCGGIQPGFTCQPYDLSTRRRSLRFYHYDLGCCCETENCASETPPN